ncbi:hypothetical protein F5Y07DRAFT_348874 [Xylaria sp. FL0933]|nr:hypothetical protein F5Y07DRAFT_348874 [Xylaria sp. FL0933]
MTTQEAFILVPWFRCHCNKKADTHFAKLGFSRTRRAHDHDTLILPVIVRLLTIFGCLFRFRHGTCCRDGDVGTPWEIWTMILISLSSRAYSFLFNFLSIFHFLATK